MFLLFFFRSLCESSLSWLNFLTLLDHYWENYCRFKEKHKTFGETALIFVSMTPHLSHLSRSFITITGDFSMTAHFLQQNKFCEVFGIALAVDLILEMAKTWESIILAYFFFEILIAISQISMIIIDRFISWFVLIFNNYP